MSSNHRVVWESKDGHCRVVAFEFENVYRKEGESEFFTGHVIEILTGYAFMGEPKFSNVTESGMPVEYVEMLLEDLEWAKNGYIRN